MIKSPLRTMKKRSELSSWNNRWESLKDAFLKATRQRKLPSPEDRRPAAVENNPIAQELFEQLGLSKFYPKGLHLKDALCIKSESLKFSLNEAHPTDPKQLPYLVLHKLMSYDYLCRSDLLKFQKNGENGSCSDDSGSDDYEDSDDDNDDNNIVCNGKHAVGTVAGIHPVDSLLALILCSDDFLCQDLLSRLAKCQLAVPFILPDPFTKQLSIPLWAMHSIVKEWKCIEQTGTGSKVVQRTHPIVNYGMPIVSFIRFGKPQRRGQSKSKILNEVISESHYDHFFHRDSPGGQYDLLLGEGLVDMCWYLPAGIPADAFPDAVTFLNLHGDARQHPQQSKFLSQISSMCFVLLNQEDMEYDKQTMETLKKFSTAPGGITILNDVQQKPKTLKKEIPKAHVVNLTKKNSSEIKESIRHQIKTKLDGVVHFPTIEDSCNLKGKAIVFNEDRKSYEEGLSLANEVKSIITGHKEKRPSAKEVMLPLQGKTLWQAWAAEDKEQYRQTHRGSKTVIEYTSEVQSKKVAIREKQLKHVDLLTPVMKSFVVSLLILGGPSNSILRNYFLQCLKLELDGLSRENISGMQLQYQATRKELAKLQVKTDPKEGDETKSTGEDIKQLKMKMKVLQEDIISASFGLEHLFREVGQIYEAALQSSVYGDDLSCLPKAAAELLIEGYPLEVMDGDAAHIPQQWVTAVFKEATKMLKDPKVFVLSVLGLQSTGKSTMLNTAFGLQFNVSAGRCTRGAFIQLLPLDEKLQAQTKCDYVLVVDTEGLRAPELDPTTIQYHDSVLATFVIGLANMTLINIYGEVPGEMDDILQISVHTFLRMNQAKCNPSCQFVHQNAGTNLSSEVGRAKFGQNLNKFAVDAAREENCEGQLAAFNDVIQFDDQKDVHHFPGLWKGDPPMAPVNQGYSHSAQMLKYQFTEILHERAKRGALVSEFRLSSFLVKVDELWKNLLKENFVFSFKNTLEITAYNSLERAYAKWDSTFQERMLSWERSAEIAFEKAEAEAVPELMQRKHRELGVYVTKEIYSPLKLEMDSFFDGEQSDILIQWKAKFQRKFRNLSSGLQEHAERHSVKLGHSREAISKIETERKEFTKLILENVEHSIASLQQEEEKLIENLEKRELKTAQLKKLLRRKLFTRDKLTKYREKNLITKVQEHRINGIIQECDGQLTERRLKDIVMGAILTKQQTKNIVVTSQLSEAELEFEFEAHWSELVGKLTYVKREDVNVEAEVEKKLTDFVHAQGYEGVLIWQLQGKRRSLREWGAELELVLEEGKHYKSSCLSSDHKEALEITSRVFDEARRYLQEIGENDTDFNAAFAHELLHLLSKKISQESASAKNRLAFTSVYRLDVYLASCSYAIPKFERMSTVFKERFDPLFYLEKHIKGPLFIKFKSQYYQTEAEEAIAYTLCSYLSEPIKTQVRSTLGRKVVMEMKSSEQHFSSKIALIVKVLEDLYDKGDFESYMVFITDVKTSLEGWLTHYTIEYCDQVVSDSGSRLQVSAKEEVSRLVQVVESQVTACNENDVSKWFSVLCNDKQIRRELGVAMKPGDLLSGYESLNKLNFKKFKLQVKANLQNLKDELLASFDSIRCGQEMGHWNDKPRDLLRNLIGCTEQCPFCSEQCNSQDPDHTSKHFTLLHRPTCLKGVSHRMTNVMMTGPCPSFVDGCEEEKYFVDRRTNRILCSFKDYQSVFPKWSIPPDPAPQGSLYWKYFVARYKNEIAKRFGAKPPAVPTSWSRVGRNQVMQSLRNQFGL